MLRSIVCILARFWRLLGNVVERVANWCRFALSVFVDRVPYSCIEEE
jgi:hypothetical protein